MINSQIPIRSRWHVPSRTFGVVEVLELAVVLPRFGRVDRWIRDGYVNRPVDDGLMDFFDAMNFGSILQMGTIRGYSVHKPRNISRDYPPTHCWLKCPFQGKQAAPPLQPLKRWKTQTLGALETTLDNIRNRDHSVHRLSAVRALNLHRRRSTCVLLTSVKCKRS